MNFEKHPKQGAFIFGFPFVIMGLYLRGNPIIPHERKCAMKGKIKKAVVLLALIAALIAVEVFQIRVRAEPETVRVSSAAELVSAVDNANDGDIIEITDMISIRSNLTLGSEEKKVTIRRGSPDAYLFVFNASLDCTGINFDGSGVDGSETFLSMQASGTFTNCSFQNCISHNTGGALAVDGNVNLINCSFQNNRANSGGHISANSGNLSLEGCTLEGGTAENLGGAISFNGSTLTIADSTITENTANTHGGILCYSAAEITNSKIYNNTAQNGGADIANMGTLAIEEDPDALQTLFGDLVTVSGWEKTEEAPFTYYKLIYEPKTAEDPQEPEDPGEDPNDPSDPGGDPSGEDPSGNPSEDPSGDPGETPSDDPSANEPENPSGEGEEKPSGNNEAEEKPTTTTNTTTTNHSSTVSDSHNTNSTTNSTTDTKTDTTTDNSVHTTTTDNSTTNKSTDHSRHSSTDNSGERSTVNNYDYSRVERKNTTVYPSLEEQQPSLDGATDPKEEKTADPSDNIQIKAEKSDVSFEVKNGAYSISIGSGEEVKTPLENTTLPQQQKTAALNWYEIIKIGLLAMISVVIFKKN